MRIVKLILIQDSDLHQFVFQNNNYLNKKSNNTLINMILAYFNKPNYK
jgi:hypothetical protein